MRNGLAINAYHKSIPNVSILSSDPFSPSLTPSHLLTWCPFGWLARSGPTSPLEISAPSGARFFVALENIEQALMYRQQTDGAAREKNSSNKRLVSQRSERTCLQVADFGDELIERLPFRFAFPTELAKPPQIVEPNCTQCLSLASERNGTAQCPRGSDCADQEETIIKKRRASDDQQCENEQWVPDQRRHRLRALCNEKNLVPRGQFLFSQ